MEKYNIIYRIADSICKLNGYTMERLDIQRWKAGDLTGYAGYLYIGEKVLIIRADGSFEESEAHKIIG